MTVRNDRWRALGFTLADYERLLAAQGGTCAVCPATPKSRRLHVDHDHKTGAVRGLLCHAHNRRLWRGATASELRRLADYVERFATVSDGCRTCHRPWTECVC